MPAHGSHVRPRFPDEKVVGVQTQQVCCDRPCLDTLKLAAGAARIVTRRVPTVVAVCALSPSQCPARSHALGAARVEERRVERWPPRAQPVAHLTSALLSEPVDTSSCHNRIERGRV
eukprot:606452-Prymnesium_polylepis.1